MSAFWRAMIFGGFGKGSSGGGGDTSIEDGMLDGTLKEYTNNRVTKLRNYAFYYSSLTFFAGENVTDVGVYCFQYSSLKNVHLPSAANIAARSFQNCYSLESISLPSLTTSANHTYLLLNCKLLKNVDLPNMLYAKQGMFEGCLVLQEINLPSVVSMEAGLFKGSTVLKKVILKHSEVVSLANANAFENTPFAAGKAGGTVYVPQALIESYQNATNWSTLYAAGTCNFVAIEGSEYE